MIYFSIMTTRAKQWRDSVKTEGIQKESNYEGHQEKKQKAPTNLAMGSPGSSTGNESTCSAEDTGLIPGLGRSTAEGIDYPLQYSLASLVAQKVKNLPVMWEIWV